MTLLSNYEISLFAHLCTDGDDDVVDKKCIEIATKLVHCTKIEGLQWAWKQASTLQNFPKGEILYIQIHAFVLNFGNYIS